MIHRPESLHHRLERHFVTCSTVTGAALAITGQQSAQAAITYIQPGVPISIPTTFEGIYFNIENGVFATTPGGAPGWDVNPYGTGNLTWYSPAATAASIAASAATGGTIVSVPFGTDLSTLTYDPAGYNQVSGAAILAGGTHFVAFTFVDGAANTNRAWLEITTSAPDGTPAQINRWAFRQITEGPLAAGEVPEPGSAALGLLAAGALGLRRRRGA